MMLADFINATGITERQANWWAMAGLFENDAATGSGFRRDYTDDDVRRAKVALSISNLIGGRSHSLAEFAPTVLAAIRLADLTGATSIAITPDRNVFVADGSYGCRTAMLVVHVPPATPAKAAA